MRQALKNGFTLIEINLAIFLVAMGMLTLFSLFPTGLKQIESASDDTQEAFFADYVLNTLRSNAAWITAEEWANIDEFTIAIMDDDRDDMPPGIKEGSSIHSIEFPALENYMRYVLEITPDGNNIRMAKLWCRNGEYGATDIVKFKNNANVFMAKFIYSGMP